jgi:hypothetical protein
MATDPTLPSLAQTAQHFDRWGVWRCVVLGWDAQLGDVKKEIAELEDRISALKRELQAAQRAADAGRVQGILAVRERHLERATLHAQFIESRIAQGKRAAKYIPYAALASICISAAKRTARVDTAETLKALAKRFSAKALADASNRLLGTDSSDSGATEFSRRRSGPALLVQPENESS